MNVFSQDEVNQADRTNLVDFLMSRGETLKREGSGYKWNYGGEAISVKDNMWFNHYQQKGGRAIGFIKEFFKVDFLNAVSILLGLSQCELDNRIEKVKEENKPPFKLPERNNTMLKAFNYLTITRGIDKEVVATFMKSNLIYENAKYHNVVFAGFDKEGNPKHAHMRGTGAKSTFKMTAAKSEPEYSFHWNGTSNEIYLFEAPIDMLSYISMNQEGWEQHTYAAACSVSDKVLLQCLKDNPNLTKIHICFDNDGPGQAASERLMEKLALSNATVDRLTPQFKDWNEDLTTPEGWVPIGNGMKID